MTPDEVAVLNGAERNAKVLQSVHPVSGTLRSAAILASAVNTAQHGSATSTNTITERNKTEVSLSVGPKGGSSRRGKETGKGTGRRRQLSDPGPSSKKPQVSEKTDGGKKKSPRSLGSQVFKRKHLRQQTAPKCSRPSRTAISAAVVTDTSDCDMFLEPFAPPPPKRKPKSSARKTVMSRPTRHQPSVSSEEIKRKPEPLSLSSNKRPKLQPSRPKTPRLDRIPRVAANRRKRSSAKKSTSVVEVIEDAASDEKQQEEEFAAYVFPSDGDGMMEVSYEPNQEDETNNLASGTEIYCNTTAHGGQTYSLKTLPGPLNSPYFLQARHNLDAILGRLTMKSEVNVINNQPGENP